MILEQWAPGKEESFYENLKLLIGKINYTAQKGLKVKLRREKNNAEMKKFYKIQWIIKCSINVKERKMMEIQNILKSTEIS